MPVLTPEERAELEAQLREVQARDGQKHDQLLRDAQAVNKAVEGWHLVEGPDAWAKTCEQSRADYHSGRFLIERLGAARLLDPPLMATLLGLRQTILAELGTATAAEQMLVDLAVLAYYNALRVQGWIGNLALHIEHEFFGQSAPSVKLKAQYGPVEGLAVEDRLKRLGEQLLPLLDRANRMMVRNLKAIKELRQGPTPAVAIARAQQVNVAERQANAMVAG